jgi:uncharacterized delta-60 repeat protein
MTRISLFTTLLLACGAALSQEGALDPTFGTLGTGRVVYGFDLPANGFDSPAGLVVDTLGRTYTIGLSAEQNNTVWRATLARLTAEGGLDNAFGSGGKVVSTDAEGSFLATDIARDSFGQLLLAGARVFGDTTQGDRDFMVCRFNTAGAAINFAAPTNNHCRTVAFDLGGNNQDLPSILKTTADGRMYLIGSARDSADFATTKIAIVKLTDTGALDSAFSGDGKLVLEYPGGNATTIFDADIGPDGSLYLAGSVEIGGSLAALAIKLSATGVLDTAFGGDGFQAYQLDVGAIGFRDDITRAVAVRSDGKLVLGGSAENALDDVRGFVLRVSAITSSFDTGFGNAGRLILGGNGAVRDLIAQGDGMTLYSRDVLSSGSQVFRVGRLAELGHDLRFASGGISDFNFGLAQAVDIPREMVLSGGRVVVMGVVFRTGSDSEFGVARLRGDAMFADDFE